MTRLRVSKRLDTVRLASYARSVARRFNLTIEPAYHSLPGQRRRLLSEHRIDTVLDVGANIGQYAGWLRDDGYRGRIISFEAHPVTAASLVANAAADPMWDVIGCALGASEGTARLFSTVDSLSTSLLPPAPTGAYDFQDVDDSQLDVEVRTLDSFGLARGGRGVLLKLDVQGLELEVLRGAVETLERVDVVECELSLIPLYDGQTLIEDVVAHLRALGFRPVCLPRGFTDPSTHEVIQVDGLFVRS